MGRKAPVALACVLVSLVLYPPTSPVGSLRFQGSVDDQIYATGWPITSLILPPATGGTGPLSYTLGPTIPWAELRRPRADAEWHTGGGGHPPHDLHGERWQEARRPCLFTITFEEDAPDGLTSKYRGRGDQVFVLNPEREELDEALYTLDLGRRNG